MQHESPDERPVIRLPDISEDSSSSAPPDTSATSLHNMEGHGSHTPTIGTISLQTPSTPRIDISRASSSSHHDSRDSSPENAIFGVEDRDPEGNKLGLGFREDGTADLRSSTEELAFLEPNPGTAEKETSNKPARKSPLMFKPEDTHRKDSQCSDIVLLSISGRTSRLSSIGSQGSGHSNASGHSNMSHISGHSNVSHISGQSRLSVISSVSRSPSPHKMLLETSFCGPKPLENDVGVVGNDKHHSEVLEQVLLARKHDPREAILAEGISVRKAKEVNNKPLPPPVQTRLPDKLTPASIPGKANNARKHSIESLRKESLTSPVITLSTLGASYKERRPENTHHMLAKPIIPPKVKKPKKQDLPKPVIHTEPNTEAGYIRIKLKPDHMYEDDGEQSSQLESSLQKPVSLNLKDQTKKNAPHFSQLVKRDDSLNKISRYSGEFDSQKLGSQTKCNTRSPSITPTASPKLGKKTSNGSRTPSPGITVSRKSSFCSLFKSRETIVSPDSPSGKDKKNAAASTKDVGENAQSSRSRSKSRDRDKSGTATPVSAGKPKGSVLAIFKPRKSSASASPVARESLPSLDGLLHPMGNKHSTEAKSVQNLRSNSRLKYYDAPVDGFIRIPLHTPSDEDEKNLTADKPPAKNTFREEPHQLKIDRPKSAPSSSRPSISHQTVNMPDKYGIKKAEPPGKQVVLPDGSIRIPLHSPSEDRLVRCDLMTEKEIEETNKMYSNIQTKKNAKSQPTPKTSVSSSTAVSKNESMSQKKVEVIHHTQNNSKFDHQEKIMTQERLREITKPPEKLKEVSKPPEKLKEIPYLSELIQKQTASLPQELKKTDNIPKFEEKKNANKILYSQKVAIEEPVEPIEPVELVDPIEPEIKTDEENMSNQTKKHIIFTTKVGSKDQIFSLQFSLSKTDSQSSQMSDNRSQISEDSVIEVPMYEKRSDGSTYRSPSIDNKSDKVSSKSDLEITKIVTDEICIHSSELTDSQHSDLFPISNSENTLKNPPIGSCRGDSVFNDNVPSPRNSVDDAGVDSSESERDSELDFIRKKQLLALEKAGHREPGTIDHERKGLVLQQDSFDDELPYVPTTLPLERSVAIPIVPVKQRLTLEMKTFPIERPRSTTPINPSCLEEYCSDEVYTPDSIKAERLKISLPKEKDETQEKTKVKQKAKSPRRISSGSCTKTWFEFAEQGISNAGTRKSSTSHESDSDQAPPLPPRAPVPKSQWINFEDIPERRKLPKRIQTIPSRTNIEVANDATVVYTYVNPEDCKCECHESGKDAEDGSPDKEEDEEPLLEDIGEVDGISAPVKRLKGDPKKERRNIPR